MLPNLSPWLMCSMEWRRWKIADLKYTAQWFLLGLSQSVQELFHHPLPPKNACTMSSPSLALCWSPLPAPANHPFTSCLCGLACSGPFMERKQTHQKSHSLFDWLISLSVTSRASRVAAGISTSLLFYGNITFHCTDVPHLIYPFLNWWTFGLFPPSGSYEWCCCERLCVGMYFRFLVYISRRGTAGSEKLCFSTYGGTAGLVLKAAAPFYNPSSDAWGLPFLHILTNTWDCLSFFNCYHPSGHVEVSHYSFEEHFLDG